MKVLSIKRILNFELFCMELRFRLLVTKLVAKFLILSSFKAMFFQKGNKYIGRVFKSFIARGMA